MTKDDTEFIIPVYLNQRIVFDLLAMLQDGISTVTRVTTSEESNKKDDQRYGTVFGLGQALSGLIKIDLAGNRARISEGSRGFEKSEEKVHTPASLFQKVRSLLKEKNKILTAIENYQPVSGHLAEFSTSLKRNPLIQSIDTMIEMQELIVAFDLKDKESEKIRARAQKQIGPMRSFSQQLKAGNTIDVIGGILPSGHRPVITLEEEFLNDATLADLVEGQFTTLGKVIRVIPDSGGSFSLLRKTVFSAVKAEALTEMFLSLSNAKTLQFPELVWEIKGPLIHVLPVAIFS